MSNETCSICGQKHGEVKGLNVFCTEDELKSLELIQNKLTCAHQACNTKAIPEDTPANIAQSFFSAALNNKAEAQFLEKDWWECMAEKYKFDVKNNVHINFESKEFYIIE